MSFESPFITAALAIVISALLLRWMLSRRSMTAAWGDVPNARSLHISAVPRFGGVALHLGWLLALLTAGGAFVFPAWGLGLGLAFSGLLLAIVVSLIDDRVSLPPVPRLLAHVVSALLLIAGYPIEFAGADGIVVFCVFALTVFGSVWVMNLFNFMDGSDGLAATMAIFGFATYAFASWDRVPWLAHVALAIAGAAIGFGLFNRPPARVFMGDSGSIGLGYLSSAVGLIGVCEKAWGVWLPLMVFLPFIMDASFTLLRRLVRGDKVLAAHREHAYQKLVRSGWKHGQVLGYASVLMAVCCMFALLLQGESVELQWSSLIGLCLGVLALLLVVERMWSRSQGGLPRDSK